MSLETTAVTLWDKFKTWVNGEVQAVAPVLTADEQDLVGLVKPLFAGAEAVGLSQLVTFIRGVLVAVEAPGSKTLPDLETIVMNGLSRLGSGLQPVAVGLGSSVLQALIGLVLASLPKA